MKDYSLKFSLAASIIFFILCCFVFIFFYQKISTNRKTSEKIISEWQAESAKRGETQSLLRSLKMVEAEKAMLETHFAQSSDVVPFLDTIDKLAALAKTKTEVSSVDILKDGSGLEVGITTTGTFEDDYKFLLLLENSPYEVIFISTELERDAGQDTDKPVARPNWTARFKIKLISFVP